ALPIWSIGFRFPRRFSLLYFDFMCRLNFSSLLVTLIALPLAALADVVTLKSGEKLEGKITGETPTQLSIDVQVSAGITDSRTVAKADVLKVEKEQPDEIAWQSFKSLKLGPNSLPAASYDQSIGSLQSFLNQYPNSPHAAEARTLLAPFAEEKKRVQQGEVKLNQKWLSKEEVEKERYQVNAQIILNYMREQSSRDLIGALNSFDLLEKQYPGARAYPEAVELARRILQTLKAEVDRRVQA